MLYELACRVLFEELEVGVGLVAEFVLDEEGLALLIIITYYYSLDLG